MLVIFVLLIISFDKCTSRYITTINASETIKNLVDLSTDSSFPEPITKDAFADISMDSFWDEMADNASDGILERRYTTDDTNTYHNLNQPEMDAAPNEEVSKRMLKESVFTKLINVSKEEDSKHASNDSEYGISTLSTSSSSNEEPAVEELSDFSDIKAASFSEEETRRKLTKRQENATDEGVPSETPPFVRNFLELIGQWWSLLEKGKRRNKSAEVLGKIVFNETCGILKSCLLNANGGNYALGLKVNLFHVTMLTLILLMLF